MAATSLLKGNCTGIGVRRLLSLAHPHRPLNFNQINSAVNHNYHHIRICRGKLTLSPSPRLAALWNSSSPFCTAADASASASASEVVSDAAVVDEAVPVSEVVHEQKKIKDAADLLDIRVGRVLKAWRHEEAESLYVEEVDVGEPEPRIICSGLVRYTPLDHLQVPKFFVPTYEFLSLHISHLYSKHNVNSEHVYVYVYCTIFDFCWRIVSHQRCTVYICERFTTYMTEDFCGKISYLIHWMLVVGHGRKSSFIFGLEK